MCFLNVVMFSSNVLFEEFVLSLRASPLTKPFLAPGGLLVVKNMYWNVSVGLKRSHIEN